MLELIDKGSCSDTHPTPLLFVHGGWHAAWCWDEHFLDFFADNGYRALALSLRGHGGSPAAKPIHTISIADYVEDVVTVAEGLPTPPVVIGHSMGGFVVQKYLETHQAPAGVLLASIPPKGIGPFLMRWTKRQPWPMTRALLTGKSLHIFRSPEIVREKFFSQRTPRRRFCVTLPCFKRRASEYRATHPCFFFPTPSASLRRFWFSAQVVTGASQ
jgi:pimeloyl-ACP methyl ester carboxylesterase